MIKSPLMMKKAEKSENFPGEKGSYCLIFYMKESKKITVGKFGTFFFNSGFYYYFGSAKGSGGLRARINRHISLEKKNFWHIDFLRPHMVFLAAVITTDKHKECTWCQEIEKKFSLFVPVKGFGASDCLASCTAHLLYSHELVNLNEFSDDLVNTSTFNAN